MCLDRPRIIITSGFLDFDQKLKKKNFEKKHILKNYFQTLKKYEFLL